MATSSPSPSTYEVRRSEQKQQKYSDALSVTCAGLGAKMLELVELQPEVSFTRNDLIGFYQLQCGNDSYSIGKTIDMILDKASVWEEWDPAQYLMKCLPSILKPRITPAIMKKIVLGSSFGYSASIDTADLDNFMEKRKEIDKYNNQVTCLYPKDNTNIYYKGRMVQELGGLAHGAMSNISTSVDLVGLENGCLSETIMIASKEESNFHGSFVQSIRVL